MHFYNINRNFANKNIYMFLSLWVSIHYILKCIFRYKRKCNDAMTSLSIARFSGHTTGTCCEFYFYCQWQCITHIKMMQKK